MPVSFDAQSISVRTSTGEAPTVLASSEEISVPSGTAQIVVMLPLLARRRIFVFFPQDVLLPCTQKVTPSDCTAGK